MSLGKLCWLQLTLYLKENKYLCQYKQLNYLQVSHHLLCLTHAVLIFEKALYVVNVEIKNVKIRRINLSFEG